MDQLPTIQLSEDRFSLDSLGHLRLAFPEHLQQLPLHLAFALHFLHLHFLCLSVKVRQGLHLVGVLENSILVLVCKDLRMHCCLLAVTMRVLH